MLRNLDGRHLGVQSGALFSIEATYPPYQDNVPPGPFAPRVENLLCDIGHVRPPMLPIDTLQHFFHPSWTYI
jgi:hypothetical protein